MPLDLRVEGPKRPRQFFFQHFQQAGLLKNIHETFPIDPSVSRSSSCARHLWSSKEAQGHNGARQECRWRTHVVEPEKLGLATCATLAHRRIPEVSMLIHHV